MGLETSMGVGRRMAMTLSLLNAGKKLRDKPRALVLLLQDARDAGAGFIRRMKEDLSEHYDLSVIDFTEVPIRRCMACDICPADVDLDESYRCLVKNDGMRGVHAGLLDHDLIIPVVVSSRAPAEVKGDYQIFMERTRYLRRGDYIWSNLMVAPVVLQESGAISTYPLRMLTSLIRHHTIMSRPLTLHLTKTGPEDATDVLKSLKELAPHAARLAAGRLGMTGAATSYNPVGYILSADKKREDMQLDKRKKVVAAREMRLKTLAAKRLAKEGGDV